MVSFSNMFIKARSIKSCKYKNPKLKYLCLKKLSWGPGRQYLRTEIKEFAWRRGPNHWNAFQFPYFSQVTVSLGGRWYPLPIYKPRGGGTTTKEATLLIPIGWDAWWYITTLPSHPQQFFKVSQGVCWYLFILLSGEGHFANSTWIKSLSITETPRQFFLQVTHTFK